MPRAHVACALARFSSIETQRVDIRLARVHRENGQVLDATETYEQQLR